MATKVNRTLAICSQFLSCNFCAAPRNWQEIEAQSHKDDVARCHSCYLLLATCCLPVAVALLFAAYVVVAAVVGAFVVAAFALCFWAYWKSVEELLLLPLLLVLFCYYALLQQL